MYIEQYSWQYGTMKVKLIVACITVDANLYSFNGFNER